MRRLALIALLGASGCSSPQDSRRKALDEGYLLGAADAVKQLYWARQSLEAARPGQSAGKTEYYTWEETGRAPDGRKLAPETVAVPVFIPAPVPAEGVTP
jgi:hypothetical protein